MLTALVGRDEFVATVEATMHDERLVTLLGPGGIGKTSVALTVAERISDRFDLTIFVGLDEVTGEDDVLPAFSQALRLASPTMDAVTMALSNRRALIVVDNCEHVVEATAEVAEQLLRVSPNCRILATSREGSASPVNTSSPCPDSTRTTSPLQPSTSSVNGSGRATSQSSSDLTTSTSCSRFAGGSTDYRSRSSWRPHVFRCSPRPICSSGSPSGSTCFTRGRRRRSGDRQMTLRTTVDWSYELLDAEDRDAFVRLSVFAASFDLSGAAAVLDGRTDVEVLDLLTALADKSLLTVDNVDGVRRYRYLETIRSYAEDRFDETGDTATTMRSLQDHHVQMMQTLVDDLRTRWIKSRRRPPQPRDPERASHLRACAQRR